MQPTLRCCGALNSRTSPFSRAGGADRLQCTPIAHAEMNALAGIATGAELGRLTLWSSHAYTGSSSPMIARAEQREPEVTQLMRIADDTTLRQPALRDALAPAWPDIQTAARQRRSRRRQGA